MIVIPAIDIHGGRCVRMTQGAVQPEVVYSDDPLEVAQRWSRQGARWLHIIDLDGIFADRPVQLDLVRAITAGGVPVQVGGGFRTLEDIDAGLAAGAARVLLKTAPLAFARKAGRRFGDRVAALLGVREGRVVADQANSSSDPISLGKALVAAGIQRIIYTDIARDGTLTGPDIQALEAFVRMVSVPIIAAGGVASQADLVAVERAGVEGVVIGRALYEGRLDLRMLTPPSSFSKGAGATAKS